MPDVLVCGAGIAGLTLADWLSEHGLPTTVVERMGLLDRVVR
jgi:2-polyprenyl-6-methoxyphenol hydroxylase-like FAD-dependent oxidoreductase